MGKRVVAAVGTVVVMGSALLTGCSSEPEDPRFAEARLTASTLEGVSKSIEAECLEYPEGQAGVTILRTAQTCMSHVDSAYDAIVQAGYQWPAELHEDTHRGVFKMSVNQHAMKTVYRCQTWAGWEERTDSCRDSYANFADGARMAAETLRELAGQ